MSDKGLNSLALSKTVLADLGLYCPFLKMILIKHHISLLNFYHGMIFRNYNWFQPAKWCLRHMSTISIVPRHPSHPKSDLRVNCLLLHCIYSRCHWPISWQCSQWSDPMNVDIHFSALFIESVTILSGLILDTIKANTVKHHHVLFWIIHILQAVFNFQV